LNGVERIDFGFNTSLLKPDNFFTNMLWIIGKYNDKRGGSKLNYFATFEQFLYFSKISKDT